MPVFWPTAEDVNDASQGALRALYRSLPSPMTDEQRDLLERLAVRCEGCGMIGEKGRLLP